MNMENEIVNKLQIIQIMLNTCEERMEHGLTIAAYNNTIYRIIDSILDMMPPSEDADSITNPDFVTGTEDEYEYRIISENHLNTFNNEYKRYSDYIPAGELIVTPHNGKLTYTQRLRKKI